MAEQEQENNKFMDDVVTTLQSFHIGDSPDNINGNNYNSENVFQRTCQRRINDPTASTGIISSEYSSDDSQSSNERRPRSLKERIQRKLDRKSENLDTLSQKTGRNSQVPDVVPKNDPSNESSTLLENTNTDDKSNLPITGVKGHEGDYNTSNSTITEVKGEEPDNLKLNSPIKEVKGEEQPIVKPSISTITEDNQSAANQLNNHTQNTADKSGSEIKPPERRRRRFITREKENEEVNTSVTPDITQIVPSTGTPTRTRTRRSMLNQSNEENTTPDVSTGDTTVRTRSRRSILNQSAESVLRAKSVEHTVRVRSSGLLNSNQDVSSSLNITSQQKDLGEDQSVNTMKSSSERSAADCIRLRRVQSLERVRRPKLTSNTTSNVSINNKSCDDKQLSLPTTQVTQTPVIGSPLIAKLESTYKLLRSRRTKLSSDTSSKSEESNNSLVQNSEIQSSPKNESSPETIQSNTVPKDLTGINSKESSSISENIIGATGMTMNESKNNFKPCSAEKQDSTSSIHDVETKDVTLIFKSDETMDRPSLDPDIHQVETKTAKLDPSIYPLHDISQSSISDQDISNTDKSRHRSHHSSGSEQNISNNDKSPQRTFHTSDIRSYSEQESFNGNQEMTQKGSKSSDILDAASNNSPLGRTTDLDQAMKQRDEEKLRKLFKNSETEIKNVQKHNECSPGITNQNETDMETDLDHFPVPLTKTSDNFHNMSLISPGSPKSFIEQGKVSSSPKPFTEQTKALTSPKPFTEQAKILSSPKPFTEQAKTLTSPKLFTEQAKTLTSPKPFTEETKALHSPKSYMDQAKALSSPKPFSLSTEHKAVSNSLLKQKQETSETEAVGDKDNTASKEYSPYVNLDDAVKWPAAVPGTLDFSHMEVFEGMNYLF